MRRALGVASVFTILSLAGAASAQVGNDGTTPLETVPGASTAIAGGPAGSLFPASPYEGGRSVGRLTPRKVYAVVGQRLVSGDAAAPGQVVLKDEAAPDYICVGRFQPARHGGPVVRLACSDGSQVKLTTTAFTEDSGFGRTAEASVTYGFRAEAAVRRLVAPAGYVLVADDGMLSLKPAGA